MLRRMDWEQLKGWMVYAELEPFGEQRADIRMGILASLIYNAHRSPKSKSLAPADFIPKWGDTGKRKPLTDQAQWMSLKQIVATNYSREGRQGSSQKRPAGLNVSERRRQLLESQGKLPEVVR